MQERVELHLRGVCVSYFHPSSHIFRREPRDDLLPILQDQRLGPMGGCHVEGGKSIVEWAGKPTRVVGRRPTTTNRPNFFHLLVLGLLLSRARVMPCSKPVYLSIWASFGLFEPESVLWFYL